MNADKHEGDLRAELARASAARDKARADYTQAHAHWVKLVVAVANSNAGSGMARPAFGELEHADGKP